MSRNIVGIANTHEEVCFGFDIGLNPSTNCIQVKEVVGFYWRTASGQEVDVVLENREGKVAGIEIKASASLGANDVRGLQALADAVGKSWICGMVLYAGTETIPFSEPAWHSLGVTVVRIERCLADEGRSGHGAEAQNGRTLPPLPFEETDELVVEPEEIV